MKDGWGTIVPNRKSATCCWCQGGYRRMTNGTSVRHDLPEPGGMPLCLDVTDLHPHNKFCLAVEPQAAPRYDEERSGEGPRGSAWLTPGRLM